jgi:hypothetical protein
VKCQASSLLQLLQKPISKNIEEIFIFCELCNIVYEMFFKPVQKDTFLNICFGHKYIGQYG